MHLTPAEQAMAVHLAGDADAREAARRFAVRIPPAFAQCIDWDDPADPLLRQVLPSARELDEQAGFNPDPLQEAGAMPAPGLVRKYRDRALLLVTADCPIHCRFCFRRHQLQGDPPALHRAWEGALAWIGNNPEIREVILSGGEPLMLPDAELAELMARAAAIPHVQRVRIHTRCVVAIPERIGDGVVQALTATRLTPWGVIHVNHPAELGAEAREAIRRLRGAGIPLLHQGVLLRGVNDTVAVLETLMETLVGLGVVPYYLHLLDPVAGASHFQVPEEEGRRLIGALRERISGYAVPRLAREVPGTTAKRVLAG